MYEQTAAQVGTRLARKRNWLLWFQGTSVFYSERDFDLPQEQRGSERSEVVNSTASSISLIFWPLLLETWGQILNKDTNQYSNNRLVYSNRTRPYWSDGWLEKMRSSTLQKLWLARLLTEVTELSGAQLTLPSQRIFSTKEINNSQISVVRLSLWRLKNVNFASQTLLK